MSQSHFLLHRVVLGFFFCLFVIFLAAAAQMVPFLFCCYRLFWRIFLSLFCFRSGRRPDSEHARGEVRA